MDILQKLEEISQLPGISGQEHAVRQWICGELEGHCDYNVDPLGNVIAFKKGAQVPKNKLLFSAHMDEIGFIITNILDNGLLRFATVGGIDSRVIFGKPVQVGKNLLPGVIGGKPIHLTEKEEALTPPEVDSLYIDIGATTKEEAEAVVSLGDFAVYNAPFLTMGKHTIVGKALDDRAGCVMMLDLIQGELPYDCTFTFTVQEEIGCVGGRVVGYEVNPDIAVIVETTTASDIGGVATENHVCRQGDGPVVSYMDRGAIYDYDLYKGVRELAAEHNIPTQTKEGVYGGNEARSLQIAQDGVRVVGVSLPARYLHSPSTTLHTQDIVHTRALLEHLISYLAQQ